MSDTEDKAAPQQPSTGQPGAEQTSPDNANPTGGSPAGDGAAGQQPPLNILHQYVKDLSFENPSTPRLQLAPGTQPTIDIRVDVTATALDEKVYEVELHMTFKASAKEQVIYLGELVYACVAQLGEVRQQDVEPLLLIETPRLMFPYARAIIGNATRDGGFQPLVLAPFDFVNLYRRRLEARAAQQSSESGNA